MNLCKWKDLPDFMQCEEVRPYYEHLKKKSGSLILKRCFDVMVAAIFLIILALPMLVIGACIKLDSKGPVFYRQERVTRYGRKFRIHKFRTMVDHAEQLGSAVTVSHDSRVTDVGRRLRRVRLDELPQLLDVLQGTMSFVGTRPEAVKYVAQYTPEMNATLLLPAGITSKASILYKDEERLLHNAADADRTYVEEILPEKMTYNLKAILNYSFWDDIKTMFVTVYSVLK